MQDNQEHQHHVYAEASVDDVLVALRGSETLEALGVSSEDLELAREDSDLLETLRITHEILLQLKESDQLGTFLQLPKKDRNDFLRWIAMTDGRSERSERTKIFISALKESPLGSASTEAR